MIRRINKVVALVLIMTSICAVAPVSNLGEMANLNIFSIEAKAATATEEEALNTVESAMIPTKLSAIYTVNPNASTVSKYEKCGSLSYTLNDTAAGEIAAIFTNSTNMTKIEQGVTNVKLAGDNLVTNGNSLIAIGTASSNNTQIAQGQAYLAKGTQISQSATDVLSSLNNMKSLTSDKIIAMVK